VQLQRAQRGAAIEGYGKIGVWADNMVSSRNIAVSSFQLFENRGSCRYSYWKYWPHLFSRGGEVYLYGIIGGSGLHPDSVSFTRNRA
jgi:hypothetical protein